MNRPSSSAVGNSSTMASQRSSSSLRSRGTGRRPSATPETPVTAMRYLPIALRGLKTLRRVDLLQLALGPLHRVLGGHALHRLGVHVGDDVLAEAFLRLGARRAGETRRLAELGRDLVGRHDGIDVPQLVALPLGRAGSREALLGFEELAVVGLGVEVLQELL